MEPNHVSSSLERWSKRLKDLTVTPLTRDYPDPSAYKAAHVKCPIEAVESLTASGSVSKAFHSLRVLGTSFELLLASYVILVSRLTGDDDIAIGTNAEPKILPFVLRVSVAPTDPFAEVVSKVKQVSRIPARDCPVY
jgi:L-2-aminoadipate reductase